MITNVKIMQVVGKFKRFPRGPGLLMRGEIYDGECQIPVHAFSQDFPIGLIGQFIVGRELSCYLMGRGQRLRAEVLPFDNQPGKVISPLLSALVHLANEAGGQELEKLPDLSVKQSNVLPPPPHPEAERLERLLALDAEPPDPFPVDSFPDEEAPF